MWPPATWSIQRYHFYCCCKFAARPKIVGTRISENKTAMCATSTLVFIIYGRTRRGLSARALAARSGTRRGTLKFTSVNFYRHADILTLLLARAAHWSVWARFYDRKPSNADRFTRKRLFAPFRRVCGHLIRRRNNEPGIGRRSLSGFSVRKPPIAADYGCGSIVSSAESAIRSSGFRWPEPATG